MYLAFILTFFILYSWLYVYAYITFWLFYTILFLFYFNFILIRCDFYISEMLCLALISVNLHLTCLLLQVHAKSYFNMKNLLNKLSINNHQAWSRINIDGDELHGLSVVLWRYNCCSRKTTFTFNCAKLCIKKCS